MVVFKISLSKKISPPLIMYNHLLLSPIHTLYDVSALALGQRLKFVAVTTYRYGVRFRRPEFYIYVLNIIGSVKDKYKTLLN